MPPTTRSKSLETNKVSDAVVEPKSRSDHLVSVAAILLLVPSAVAAYGLDPKTQIGLVQRAAVGVATFAVTVGFVPTLAVYTARKGLHGKDLGKRHMPELRDIAVPSALGIVSAIVFLAAVIGCQCMFATSQEHMARYNSALTSVCFMVLLGFMDDVLDLPWRAKIFLPMIASFPLLVTYTGSTSIVVPKPLRFLLMASEANGSRGSLSLLGALIDRIPTVTVDTSAFGAIIECGALYQVYMAVMAVFSTNAINIYAGINGLEAGQSYVIGCGILLYCLLQLQGQAYDSEQYLFAITLVVPFLGSTLGLLWHNWFPSKVFVGDTYCYFAGT